MAKTVIGLFDRMEEARHVVQALIDHGFPRDDISLVSCRNDEGAYITERGDEQTRGAVIGAGAGAALGGLGGLLVGLGALAIPGVGPIIAAGPLLTALAGVGIGAAAGGLIGALTDLGVPEEEAHAYAEGVRQGGVLLAVDTDDERADRAAEIMERAGAVDVDARATHGRQHGWTRFDPAAAPGQAAERQAAAPHRLTEPQRAPEQHAEYVQDAAPIRATEPGPECHMAATSQAGEPRRGVGAGEGEGPVIEEPRPVGRRPVPRGGVRLYTRAAERWMGEAVRLRDERVTIERQPVDRPAGEADFAAAKQETIEGTEPDAARRTEMAAELIGTEHARKTPGFDTYEADFRRHYNATLASCGVAYGHWAPAYRYGYALAGDRRYAGRDWAAIEAEARRDWETRHQGMWDEVQEPVRYAWDKGRGRV